MAFKEGDVVKRRIGSPVMTVERIRRDELIDCVWHDLEGHVQRDTFASTTLIKMIALPRAYEWVPVPEED